MGLDQDAVVVRRTPTALVTAAVFQEIDRTVHLVCPTISGDSPPGLVD
jgi:hypothetical protein